jgi:hypothetical protein
LGAAGGEPMKDHVLRPAALALVVAVSLLVLPGCAWLLGPVPVDDGGAEERWQQSDLEVAMANVRTVIPALEAWYAENNTYEGATVKALRAWDAGIADVQIVRADVVGYCVESSVGQATASKHGPTDDIGPRGC